MPEQKAETQSVAKVGVHDLFLMIGSTIRYSLGRDTYMPTFCEELLLNYGHNLTDQQLIQISHEIRDEINPDTNYGEVPQLRQWQRIAMLATRMVSDSYWASPEFMRKLAIGDCVDNSHGNDDEGCS